jgi:hypothetical protein
MKEYPNPLGGQLGGSTLRPTYSMDAVKGIMREFMNRRSGGYRLPFPQTS